MDVKIDLKTTLELHAKWVRGEGGGIRANLIRADLTDASCNLRRLLLAALGPRV